jgi:hypothetical protein
LIGLLQRQTSVYATKLPKMAQANMQLAFLSRLKQITSPIKFHGVLSELALKQIAMSQNLVFSSQTK